MPPDDRPVSRRQPVVAACVALSLVPVLIGGLVWWDNRGGFRDAGAFADLLAAIFGMISVIWLVAAVFLQREELMLQRQELSLQRGEVRRLADETNRQASLMNEQLMLQRQSNFVADFRSFLLSEEKRMAPLMREIETAINELALRHLGAEDALSFRRLYGIKHISVSVDRGQALGQAQVRVRYAEVAIRVRDNPRVAFAHALWRHCQRMDLGPWFRRQMAHSVGPAAGLTAYQILAFANLAARARPGPRA